jgi:TRAP-type C4-dicarboxylate transport system permease large subunit
MKSVRKTKKPLDWVFRATYPYLIALAIVPLFIAFVPIPCLWLPSLFFR